MTREERKEAIKLLTQYIDYDAETPDYYEMEKACKVAIKELEQEPCEDSVSRQAVLELINADWKHEVLELPVEELPPVTPTQRWIPVSERLPEDLEPVNITWVNHEPEPYYHDIKDRNFVATGIYYRGQWYWYSTTCADYLGEYGSNEIDKVDDAVEIIAWMPLPPSYQGEENG